MSVCVLTIAPLGHLPHGRCGAGDHGFGFGFAFSTSGWLTAGSPATGTDLHRPPSQCPDGRLRVSPPSSPSLGPPCPLTDTALLVMVVVTAVPSMQLSLVDANTPQLQQHSRRRGAAEEATDGSVASGGNGISAQRLLPRQRTRHNVGEEAALHPPGPPEGLHPPEPVPPLRQGHRDMGSWALNGPPHQRRRRRFRSGSAAGADPAPSGRYTTRSSGRLAGGARIPHSEGRAAEPWQSPPPKTVVQPIAVLIWETRFSQTILRVQTSPLPAFPAFPGPSRWMSCTLIALGRLGSTEQSSLVLLLADKPSDIPANIRSPIWGIGAGGFVVATTISPFLCIGS